MTTQRPFAPIAIIVVLLSAFCLLPSVFGQSTTATLSGTVTDQNGAVVPAAEITVENISTALKRHATTNDEGYFTVPLLPPSTYSVTAQRTGFTPMRVENVILNVADQKALKIELKTGEVTAQVQVISEAPLISTSSAVATTIDRTLVSNLPLNGRSFSSLVLLTPGVTVATSNFFDRGQFSVNGQRASSNYITVDGVSANIGAISDAAGGVTNLALAGAYPGTSAFGGTNNLVSIDALEEFKIQTSSYSADSGRQPGGQVQVVTRSGANQFHGALFEYFRNEALDARNYFNFKPAQKPPLRQNHFGGTFSGPVYLPRFGAGSRLLYKGKDRTFFFFSYEAQRLRLPSSGVESVPSLRLRQLAAPALRPILNSFAMPTGAETTTTTVCTPSPTNPSCAPNGRRYSGFAPFNYSLANPNNLDATSIRIDHAISTKLALFGRFNESPSFRATGVEVRSRAIAKTRTLTIGANSVLSQRLSNEFRFNYSRQESIADAILTTVGGAVPVDPLYLTNGYPRQQGVTFRVGTSRASIFSGTDRDIIQRQLNFVDNLSFTKDSHQLKFGIDVRRLSPIYGTADQQSMQFREETAISTGLISSFATFTNQPSRPRFDNYSLYAQDTWKVSGRLTLGLGLRWEINPAPTEANGKMPPLALGVVGTDVTHATLAPAGTQFYKTSYTAFAPRVGAAYQLKNTAGHETIIRGGFGVYYDLGNGSAAGGWPFFAGRNVLTSPPAGCVPPLTFPIPLACSAAPGITLVTALPTTTAVYSLNENLKLPYSLHWNFAVEQSLSNEQTVSVSYVASAGRRLLGQLIVNSSGLAGTRPNPNFGTIVSNFNGPTSDYNSMQVQYQARLKKGLKALINYAWAHAIDEASSDIDSTALSRGNADFDIRHNLSAAFHYDIPLIGAGRFADAILRNWSADTIIHAQSGQPIDALTFSTLTNPDGASLFVRPDLIQGVPLYINDSTVPGGRRFNVAAFRDAPPTRQGTFGRNILRALPLYQVDIAVGRIFKFSERTQLQIKGEVFNVFNHPMFGSYGTDFTSPSTFGVPATTMNSSLGGLSSLYQLGGPRSIQFSARLSF